jgi:hypothetical protein
VRWISHGLKKLKIIYWAVNAIGKRWVEIEVKNTETVLLIGPQTVQMKDGPESKQVTQRQWIHALVTGHFFKKMSISMN